MLCRGDLDAAKLLDPALASLSRTGDGLVNPNNLNKKTVESLIVDTLDFLLDELGGRIDWVGAALRQRSIVLAGNYIRSYVNRMILRASAVLDRKVVGILIGAVCGVDVLDPVRVNRFLIN